MNRRFHYISVLTVFVAAAAVSGCLDSPDPISAEQELEQQLAGVNAVQLQKDIEVINDSLAKWSIVAAAEPEGVRYVVSEVGSGPNPKLDNYINFRYTGRLLTTKAVFDQNDNITYRLRDLILGFKTTLPLLNEGSKATLYIPSGLGYGAQPAYNQDGSVAIPANSNLIFEIEILDVF